MAAALAGKLAATGLQKVRLPGQERGWGHSEIQASWKDGAPGEARVHARDDMKGQWTWTRCPSARSWGGTSWSVSDEVPNPAASASSADGPQGVQGVGGRKSTRQHHGLSTSTSTSAGTGTAPAPGPAVTWAPVSSSSSDAGFQRLRKLPRLQGDLGSRSQAQTVEPDGQRLGAP